MGSGDRSSLQWPKSPGPCAGHGPRSYAGESGMVLVRTSQNQYQMPDTDPPTHVLAYVSVALRQRRTRDLRTRPESEGPRPPGGRPRAVLNEVDGQSRRPRPLRKLGAGVSSMIIATRAARRPSRSGKLTPIWAPTLAPATSVGGAVSPSGGGATQTLLVSATGVVSSESIVAVLVKGCTSAAAPLLMVTM